MGSLTTDLSTAIQQFTEQTPPARLSRHLRNLLLEHIALQKDGYSFNMDELLHDMLNLFELLDAMAEVE
jgi:hypothetical protein